MKYKSILSILLTLLLSTQVLAEQASLHVSDPWVREAPPTAKVLAAYMTIMNHGKSDASIISATSPQFGRIELHSTKMENGMARMVREEQLDVPAGGSITLKPGGMHMMLFDPTEAITAGGHVMITLKTADGQSVMVHANVRKGEGMGNMQNHDHMKHMH